MANMHGKPRTKVQAYRINLITQELGCMACWLDGRHESWADGHHCDDQKQDHDRTYALCPWHHRGLSAGGWHTERMEKLYGPSKAINSKAFTTKYGSEQELLDKQNERIAEWEKNRVSKVL